MRSANRWAIFCRFIAPAAGLAAFAFLPLQSATGETHPPNLGLGHESRIDGAHGDFLQPGPFIDPSITVDHPLYARISVPWSVVERVPGAYWWGGLDGLVEAYRAANYVLTLAPYGANPAFAADGALPGEVRPEVLKGWLDFLRQMAFRYAGRVSYYEIWEEPNRVPGWRGAGVSEYGFLLKNSSVTIRSADAAASIVQGGIAVSQETAADDFAWQAALYDEEISTYVDVLAVRPASTNRLDQIVSAAYDMLLREDPSAQLWMNSVPVAGASARERAADIMQSILVAHGEGAAVVTLGLRRARGGEPELRGVILDLHKLLTPDFGLVHGGIPRFEAGPPDDLEPVVGITAYQFFDAESFQGRIVFVAPPGVPE
ncbi:MAG: hypothetical protein V3S56_09160, partial [Gemmatimonadota bacterium]